MNDATGVFAATLGQFFGGLWRSISNLFGGIGDALDFGSYAAIVAGGKETMGPGAWVAVAVALLLVAVLAAAVIFAIVQAVRKHMKVRASLRHQRDLLDEMDRLSTQVVRLTKEKDRILGMRAGALDKLGAGEASSASCEDACHEGEGESGARAKALVRAEPRFPKLAKVDADYEGFDRASDAFDDAVTLQELCMRFRDYACSRLNLYYDIRTVRLFLAGMGSARLIILQGISGTGKTSLPYAWGRFMGNAAQIVSVQPSWRDRSELFGYFNEFTKRFNETEVLRRMYEATYTDRVYLTVLDEMNIARVEYYFAELLSLLEMPNRDEWVIDLVPAGWPDDPKHLEDGRFRLPPNMWFVGTANNDDSTFAVSDKVYDRAIPINLDAKGVPFDAPPVSEVRLSAPHLEGLFEKACCEHRVSQKALARIDELDSYVVEHFRLAFGNRIVKQLERFIPVYVACGGTEEDGLDYVLANKIFRKFESMNLALIRDEIDGLAEQLDALFGEGTMAESQAYLRRLKRLA